MDRKFLRPGWIVGHLLVALAVLVCLRLGRWQWDRMESGGTVQNLGYAMLWPVFGAAFVYMWFRFLQLEKLKDVEDDAELTALAAGGTTEPGSPAAAEAEPATAPSDGAEPTAPSQPGSTPGPVPSQDNTRHVPGDLAEDGPVSARPARASRTTPSTGTTVAVAMVGADDDDDPELVAYNRALAALAEKDHRRAR